MIDEERPPPIDEKYRITLRVVVVVLAYATYLLIEEDRFASGVFLGLGLLILGWSVIDRLTMWRRTRSSLMLAGGGILGMGLIALGLFRL